MYYCNNVVLDRMHVNHIERNNVPLVTAAFIYLFIAKVSREYARKFDNVRLFNNKLSNYLTDHKATIG